MTKRTVFAGLSAAALTGGMMFAAPTTAHAKPFDDHDEQRTQSIGQLCQAARDLIDKGAAKPDEENPTSFGDWPGLRCGQVFGSAEPPGLNRPFPGTSDDEPGETDASEGGDTGPEEHADGAENSTMDVRDTNRSHRHPATDRDTDADGDDNAAPRWNHRGHDDGRHGSSEHTHADRSHGGHAGNGNGHKPGHHNGHGKGHGKGSGHGHGNGHSNSSGPGNGPGNGGGHGGGHGNGHR